MQILICDLCKRRDREAARVKLPTGKFVSDPAGGASTEEIEIVDLCLLCALARLERAVTFGLTVGGPEFKRQMAGGR